LLAISQFSSCSFSKEDVLAVAKSEISEESIVTTKYEKEALLEKDTSASTSLSNLPVKIEKIDSVIHNKTLTRLRSNTTKIRSMSDLSAAIGSPSTAPVTSSLNSVIIKQGYMNKLEGGNWIKRWFSISDRIFREFTKPKASSHLSLIKYKLTSFFEQDKQPTMEIGLSSIIELTIQDDLDGKTRGYPFQLIIISKSAACIVSLMTAKERNQWRELLLDNIVKRAFLIVHLPTKEITKVAYEPTRMLSDLMVKIATKRGFDPRTHQFQIPGTTATIDKDQPLTFADLPLPELQIVPLTTIKQSPSDSGLCCSRFENCE